MVVQTRVCAIWIYTNSYAQTTFNKLAQTPLWYANLQKNSIHFLSMSYTRIHINQTYILNLQSKKSVSTAARIGPAPILCNSNNTIATSWITSSITCIRFDGVKVLATI